MKKGYIARFALGILLIIVISSFGMIINKQVTEDNKINKYLNNITNIEYLYSINSYCISEKYYPSGQIKIDTTNHTSSHYYNLIDTTDNYINLDIKLYKNKCYIVSHLKRNVGNILINNRLKYTFMIQDSTIIQSLNDLKINHQSKN